ncbi:ribonuclease HII [Candidatus Saccharibacteria bacterium]|nr:ribonuclease HII [Candidatus Saccharibacteria bacterium]
MAGIVGLDEVGRGCWAGPLVAAAVLLDAPIEGLRDSKKLSKKRREVLAAQVKSQAKAYGVGWVTPAEIDVMGLTAAVRLAMERALEELQTTSTDYDEIIIDGNYNFLAGCDRLDLAHLALGLTCRISTQIRADDSVPAVSAASIIAKVSRDEYMAAAAKQFPGYNFEHNVGYGTRAHSHALETLGVTMLHRKSFKPIQKFS